MEQNPFWEDNTAPPSQESPCILWNPNVRYIMPLIHFLIHINEVQHLYPQKLAPTSPTGGSRSVGIVRSRTKDTEILTIPYDPLYE